MFVGNWIGNRLGAIILNWAELDANCIIESQNSPNSTIILSDVEKNFLLGNVTTGEWQEQKFNTTIPIIQCSDDQTWKKVFYLPALITLSWGILTFCLTYNDSPKNYKNLTTIHTIEKEDSEKSELEAKELKNDGGLCESGSKEVGDDENITLWNVLRTIPTAWFLSFGYFAIKGARYWMYYWANTYMIKLTNELISESIAANIMVFMDIGAFASSLVLGPMLMKYTIFGKSVRIRPAFLCFLVCGLMIPTTTWFYRTMSSSFERDDVKIMKVIMLIIGFLLAIPDGLFSGICAADMAKYDGRAVQATLSGFINGFAGWGPFIGSPITGEIWERYGSCEKNADGRQIDKNCEENIGVIIYVVYAFMLIGVIASLVADIMLKRQKTKYEAKISKMKPEA